MPPISGLRVIRSPIHGYGVVATRDFEPGEVIAEVEGIPFREDELFDDRYALWLDNGNYLDMVDQTRWVNHSCDPNAEVDGDAGWAKLMCIKAIRAGDEITYDYAFTVDLAEPCACGATGCRGWIVDADELPALLIRLGQKDGAAA
jgi:uncharacterized protein